MRQIPLTQGKVALVSDHRYEHLNQWKWHAKKCRNTWYAERSFPGGTVFMHREITSAPKELEVDHWDGDGLNNVDENLRLCTHSDNQHNRRKMRSNTSGFIGVSPHRHLYRACIYVNSKQVYLGSYEDPHEAAKVRDDAALRYFGKFAKLNFERTES